MPNLDLIRESITCSVCNDLYTRPVFLPCFNTICAKHIIEKGSFREYKCNFCYKFHDIPNNGFNPNIMVMKLIESFDVKDKFNASKDELISLVNEAEKCIPEFENFCIDTFKDFQKRLLLAKEQIILKLDEVIRTTLKNFINEQKTIIKPIDSLELDNDSLSELKKDIESKFDASNKASIDDLNHLRMELDSHISEISCNLNKVDDIKKKITKMANSKIALDDIERLIDPSCTKEKQNIGTKNKKASTEDEFKENYIIACSKSSYNIITIWNMHTQEVVRSFEDPIDTIESMHVLPHSRLLTVTKDFKLKLWDLERGKFIKVLNEHKGAVNCMLCMQPNFFLVGGLSVLEIWNFDNRSFKDVGAHKGHINCLVKFNEDYFISGANDHFIKVWDFNLGKHVRIFRSFGPVTNIVVAKNLHFSN